MGLRSQEGRPGFIRYGPAQLPGLDARPRGLWSRAELAEKRKDAQTARETQVAIPRDLKPSQYRAFLADIAAPYVAAGAIVDVTVHVPLASDGDLQPHAHLLLTTRALDPTTETGFASKRNAALAAFFDSGGRKGGGGRGDAMTAERARIAAVVNDHLRAAGSRRRADPRSYAARGDPRQPEPKLGEQRMAAIRKRRSHDRRSAVVAGMRATRKLENEITKLEMEMALKARGFARAPARQTRAPHQQDYKAGLLRDRFPDLILPPDTAAALYMVDVRDPRRTRALLRDGAWVETDDESGTVTMWGPHSADAAALASTISEATGYGVDHLSRTAAASKPGTSRRKSAMPEEEAVTLADRWRRRGFSDVSESPAGVRVGLGGRSRLLDQGDQVDLHGPVSDAALRALAAKAAEDWSGRLELEGPWPRRRPAASGSNANARASASTATSRRPPSRQPGRPSRVPSPIPRRNFEPSGRRPARPTSSCPQPPATWPRCASWTRRSERSSPRSSTTTSARTS